MTHTWWIPIRIALFLFMPSSHVCGFIGFGDLARSGESCFYAGKQKELNAKDTVDYEEVLKYKLGYCQEYFAGRVRPY